MAPRRIAWLMAAVCLIVGASAQATPPAPPLISNGAFENATLDPWVVFVGAVPIIDQSQWTPAGGKQSVELAGDAALYQDVTTTAGQRYDLSFAYSGNPTISAFYTGCAQQGVKTLDVSWPGTLTGTGAGQATFQFDTTGHTTTSMGWQTAHVLVDAATASTRLMFRDYHAFDCGVALDSVTMQPASGTQTGTQLTSQQPWAVTGEPLVVTATVLGASSSVTPTGSVQFSVDGTASGGPVALSGGTAQISLSDLSWDQHYVRAVYTPDSASFTASAATQRFSVLRAETTTGVTVDSSPAPLGQEVLVTAHVGVTAPGSGTPTGTIQFSDEFGALGDPVPVEPDGSAAIGLTEDVGDHVVYASYSGDDGFMASFGQTDLSVFDPNAPPPTSDRLATTVSMVSSKNPINPGESYTVTATVAPATPSEAPLDGTIAFSSGTTTYGDPIPLDANHSASVTITPPPGTTRQTVRARYSGNPYFFGITGSLSERIASVFTPTIPTTTGGPPPPDTQPPIFTVKLTAARLKSALRRGLRVRVECNENCSADLRLTLTARRAKAFGMRVRGKSVVVAEGSYDFPDRKASDIVVRFTARARKALAKASRVPLRLTTTASDLSGNDGVQAQTVTLKR